MGLDYFEQRKDAQDCIKQVKQQTWALAGTPALLAVVRDQYPNLMPETALNIPPEVLFIIAAIFLCGALVRIEIIRSDWRRINAMLHDAERREGMRYDPDRGRDYRS